MNYEILSIETTKHIAELEEEVKDLRILTGKGIRKQLTINKAIKMLEYYTRYGDNIILNGNALKPILAVLRGEE